MSPDGHSRSAGQHHLLGMGCMAVAAILFPVKNSFIKAQDERVPILLAIGIYFGFQSLIATGILVCLRGHRLRNPFTDFSALTLARSTALASSLGIFFVSLRFVPIANAVTLFTMQGLFCLIFAHLLLGERMRRIHLLFLALASVGVVIIVKPTGMEEHLLVNGLPILSAAFFGLYIVLTRMVPRCYHPVELLFQDGAFAGIAFIMVYIAWTQMTGIGLTASHPDIATVIAAPAIAALIGTISSLMMINAARLTPAAKLAPISYLEIVSASFIGVFVFAEILAPSTIMGMVIIVSVCLANVMTAERPATKNPRV